MVIIHEFRLRMYEEEGLSEEDIKAIEWRLERGNNLQERLIWRYEMAFKEPVDPPIFADFDNFYTLVDKALIRGSPLTEEEIWAGYSKDAII